VDGYGWDGMGWDLCAGLLYEHRFAMLKILSKIVQHIQEKKNPGPSKHFEQVVGKCYTVIKNMMQRFSFTYLADYPPDPPCYLTYFPGPAS